MKKECPRCGMKSGETGFKGEICGYCDDQIKVESARVNGIIEYLETMYEAFSEIELIEARGLRIAIDKYKERTNRE